jgi:peptide-methionine (S)-S-oxide reductase
MTAEDTFGKRIEDFAGIKILWSRKGAQNYYNDNKSQGYCSYVITSKIDKLKKMFEDKLKK